MHEDFIRDRGLPFLAHRLRRASELILEGTGEALRAAGFKGPARSVSTLLLLREGGPMGVTEIGQRLRLSHPLIIKLTRALAEQGLVEDQADPSDNRRRLIALTAAGRKQAAFIEAYIERISRAFETMFGESGQDLLAALVAFEEAAARRPIADRIADQA
jgi:DNA-binding MarR family transcriptional regulator